MENKDVVYLYGASGHAKVVKDIAKLAYLDVPCLIDDNPNVNELDGLKVVHSAEGLFPLIVTIGDCQIRRKIVEKLGENRYMTVVHPKAVLADSVKLGYGTVVMAGAILNPDVSVGDHCIINTGASVDHECQLGDFVHISPHSTLCGNVHVGEGTWVGAGSTVIQGVKIGAWSVIGAGSVVTRDVPDGTLYVTSRSALRRVCYSSTLREMQAITLPAPQQSSPADRDEER